MGHESAEDTSGQLIQVIDQLDNNADDEDVTVGEIMDAIADRGFGPVLLVPALISISPLGAIPGMSILTGSLIVIIAIQLLIGMQHPWIPSFIEQFTVPREKLHKSMAKGRRWAIAIDEWVGKRLAFLVQGPAKYMIPLVMLALALTYFPLAVIPFGVFLPGLANSFFAIGLTIRDGLLIGLGYFMSAIAIWIAVSSLM